jgi:hypothetical protein
MSATREKVSKPTRRRDVTVDAQKRCLTILRGYASKLAIHATDPDADVCALAEQMRQILCLVEKELAVSRSPSA